MATDLTKDARQILIDLINEANATTLTLDDIRFGGPSPIENGNRNTGITITALPTSPYVGSRDLTYNRVDLSELPGERSTTFNVANHVTAFDMIPVLNDAYSINLSSDDIFDDPLPEIDPNDPDQKEPFVLRAKPGSLVYRNRITLTIRSNEISLAGLLVTDELSGFEYTGLFNIVDLNGFLYDGN